MTIFNTVEEILTHKEDGLGRRLEQYKNKLNLQKILEIYLDRYQEIEELVFLMFLARSVNDATGQQLDEVGDIVGIKRPGGLADEPFRAKIFVKIGQNVSEGDPERIIDVARILTGSAYVNLLDLGSGSIELMVTEDFPDQAAINEAYKDLELVLAGGVRLNTILCADETEAFALDGPNVDKPALGLDDTTDTSGGRLAKHHFNAVPFALAGTTTDAGGLGAGSADPLAGGALVKV